MIGLTEAEVLETLGEPTSERFAPEWESSYWLRPQGFCMDGHYLVINYDLDRRVSDARVVTD